MSQSPGIKNLPVPSTTRAPSGTLNFVELSIAVMRPPEITTVISGLGGAPVASMIVTWTKARGRDGATGFVCAMTSAGSRVANTINSVFLIRLCHPLPTQAV